MVNLLGAPVGSSLALITVRILIVAIIILSVSRHVQSERLSFPYFLDTLREDTESVDKDRGLVSKEQMRQDFAKGRCNWWVQRIYWR